jgi:hypothetical protein
MAEKKIGKLEYRVERMPAFVTVKMGRRLANLFGPALPGVVSTMRVEDGGDRDAAALAAFGALATSLDERFEGLIRELTQMAEVKWNGQWVDVAVEQDELVQDGATLVLIAWFVLETNFRSFFSGPLAKALGGRTPASPTAG